MVAPIDSVRLEVYNETKWIVAVCSICGRWRDSIYQWITPPRVVEALVDAEIIGLSHTYCADCLRAEANKQSERRYCDLYNKQADREDQRAKAHEGQDYQPGDFVHNLTLGILPSGKELK